MTEIFKMAQKVAENITENNSNDIKPGMDMSKLISQVTSSVSSMVTPEFIEQMSNNSNINLNTEEVNTNSKINLNTEEVNTNSKINLNTEEVNTEEVNTEEVNTEEVNINSKMCKVLKTKDLHFTLNVTLEDLYNGKQKKLGIRRKKITTIGKKKSIIEEKKKLTINIEPGMHDEQIIVFNNLADEKPGYETGDILITLCCSENDNYERENNNLLIEKEISLYELYNCNMTLKHLNGEEFNITSSPINVFSDDELDCFRKIINKGMPILKCNRDSDKEYGDLIIKFTPKIPVNLNDEQLELIKNLFPKINNDFIPDKEITELEIVTESDFDYSDSEYDSDYDSEDESEKSSDNNNEK